MPASTEHLPTSRGPASSPSPSDSTPRTGWQRNGLRMLILGAAAALVLFVGIIATIVIGSFALMRSSGACQDAVARAERAPAVVQALGSPLVTGWIVWGTLNPGRNAKMTIPVSGPNGKARIYVVASKKADDWVFSTLTVRIASTDERIALAEQPPVPGAPSQR